MSERIGSHGWRIWKEKGLPQEVVPLSDAEGVVAQLEEENTALKRENGGLRKGHWKQSGGVMTKPSERIREIARQMKLAYPYTSASESVAARSLYQQLEEEVSEVAQLEAELDMYERDETFGTLAIQLAKLEAENEALRDALGKASRFNELAKIESPPAWDSDSPFQKEVDALLADTQESE